MMPIISPLSLSSRRKSAATGCFRGMSTFGPIRPRKARLPEAHVQAGRFCHGWKPERGDRRRWCHHRRRRKAAEKIGIKPMARLVACTTVDVPPEIMGAGAVPAISSPLEQQGLSVDDIDYWEINEAFAVVNVYAERQLGIPHAATNLYGGSMSIDHPPAATGIRMTLTAIGHLDLTGERYAVISM
jgi:acetyl-CoA acetyltransferase